MRKNHKEKMSNSLCGLLLALVGIWVTSCGDSDSDADTPQGETLAEYVARCESFTGGNLSDCPDDCTLVDAVRVLDDGAACEMETDGGGLPIREDLCLAADPDYLSIGSEGAYRRVEVGSAADDPITPAVPEEVLLLDSGGEYSGWELCTEDKSDLCGCALELAESD